MQVTAARPRKYSREDRGRPLTLLRGAFLAFLTPYRVAAGDYLKYFTFGLVKRGGFAVLWKGEIWEIIKPYGHRETLSMHYFIFFYTRQVT